MALESTVQMQQNDGNRTPEKPVDREKVTTIFEYFNFIQRRILWVIFYTKC